MVFEQDSHYNKAPCSTTYDVYNCHQIYNALIHLLLVIYYY
jgi:hypothetical protein